MFEALALDLTSTDWPSAVISWEALRNSWALGDAAKIEADDAGGGGPGMGLPPRVEWTLDWRGFSGPWVEGRTGFGTMTAPETRDLTLAFLEGG